MRESLIVEVLENRRVRGIRRSHREAGNGDIVKVVLAILQEERLRGTRAASDVIDVVPI